MKKILLTIAIVSFIAGMFSGCTSGDVKPNPVNTVICGVADVTAGFAAMELQKAQECEDYLPLKNWVSEIFSKVFSCDAISVKSIGSSVCGLALDAVIGQMSAQSGYAEAVVAAKCKHKVLPQIDTFKTSVCSKIPF